MRGLGTIERLTQARLPTEAGEGRLHLYRGEDGKEHLALVVGAVAGRRDVLVRIHSECMTGDVLGSQRCDCGEQLAMARSLIAREGTGILVYLRQEGRGIGLLDKLRAYNLQDSGYDTIDANLLLGHQADERDYSVAAHILRDLGVLSVRLLTNNPSKLESLERLGFLGSSRVALPPRITRDNAVYLRTKALRMRHLLDLRDDTPAPRVPSTGSLEIQELAPLTPMNGRPSVTLTYAQSLDGSIAVRRGEPMVLSGPQSMTMTHGLRARHDAILVGIETVLADDPRLTVRLVEGPDPQPVVLDSRLRLPVGARLLGEGRRRPWIATTEEASREKERALEDLGARVLRLPANREGQVDLVALLAEFARLGIESIMVEGGAKVITSFLAEGLVDRLVLTIAPLLVGGLNAVANLSELNGSLFPSLSNPRYQWMGDNLVLFGEVARRDG